MTPCIVGIFILLLIAPRTSYLIPRSSYLIPRTSSLVPRPSYLVPRTSYLVLPPSYFVLRAYFTFSFPAFRSFINLAQAKGLSKLLGGYWPMYCMRWYCCCML